MQATTQLFHPNPLVRNGLVQSMMARHVPKGLITQRVVQPMLIDAGPDLTLQANGERVKLLGYYGPSLSPNGGRGLVMLLHGWEGCSNSSYNLLLGDAMLRAGYAIFQLNLRDHGPNLHVDKYALNRGMFNGTLIDEVAAATTQIAQLAHDQPFYIMGASMGGSFALRLAIHHSQTPFHNLKQVIAICPAINPAAATQAIDARSIYRRYFRDRWLESALAKQQRFPELYDFRPMAAMPTILEMTEWWVPRYVGYQSASEYFSHYTLDSNSFRDLQVRITIIHAANDGVIPAHDIEALDQHPLLDVQIHPSGGHVGFVDLFPLRHTLPELVMNALIL